MSEAEDRGGELVPFRSRDPQPTSDTSFEVELDDMPAPAAPALVDIPSGGTLLLPVIPEQWRGMPNIRRELARQRAKHWHKVRYHGLRSPGYLVKAIFWGMVGVFALAGRQLRWWWWMEGHYLLSQAAASGDSREALRLHKESKETRRIRGMVLLSEAVAIASVLGFLAWYGRWWAWALLIAAVLPFLAHLGRPKDAPIITPATVTPRFRRLSADIVLRAYYAAGLGHPDKPDMQVTFGSPMARDGEGSRVSVDLPYGKSLKDAVDKKDSIASGLDVTESQVFLHRDPTSTRRHTLWVADRDPLAVPVGRTPLLACRQTDIWKPAPVGLDERGQLVKVPMMWNSLLVGALPRQGKSFTARLIALYAALDPYCQLDVFDGKGSPDWRRFSLVADSCAFGLTPTKDGLPPEILLQTLNGLKDDVQQRYERLSELHEKNPAACPEGKLTRTLARNPAFRMPVRMLVIDEIQEYYDLGKISDPIAELIGFLVKVAPGAGVIVLASTQRPSGIGGTGNVQQRFTAARDNFQLRYSLRTSDYRVSEMVLGAGSYGEGLDSSKLLPEYKGVGILRGASDVSPTVRAYLADGEDAAKILAAARAIRERAGTLSGMALGETTVKVETSILADVLAVLGNQPALHWATLATLLAARFPERHAAATADSVSAQCRAEGVPSVPVKHLGETQRGCRREDVERVTRS